MIHKVEQSSNNVRVWPDAATSFLYTFVDLVGVTDDERADDLASRVQSDLDMRVPRSTLPDDDPDKNADPARDDLFWDGDDLVGRSVVVTATPNNGGYDVRFKSL